MQVFMTGNGFLQLRSLPFARTQFSFLPIPSLTRVPAWCICGAFFSGDQQVWVDGKPDQEERRGHRAETAHDQEDDAVQAVPAEPARRAAQLQGNADAAVVMLLTFILINISIPSAPTLSFLVLKHSFSANPSRCSLPFLLQNWLRGLFTDTYEHIRFLLFSFSVFHFLVVGSVR